MENQRNDPQRLSVSLPPAHLRFMRESDEEFLALGVRYARILTGLGFRPEASILDVGSGYGRLAFGILSSMNFRGRYEGFDILDRHVSWCAHEVTPKYRNFNFTHLNVRNDRYNPTGTLDQQTVRFPYESQSFDFCAVFSVFTHMFEPGVRRYLDEIRRVLRDNGICVCTFFLFNDARIPAIISSDITHNMKYRLDEVSRYHSLDDKLHAIAYEEWFIRNLMQQAGLRINKVSWGSWAGEARKYYQDTLIITPSD